MLGPDERSVNSFVGLGEDDRRHDATSARVLVGAGGDVGSGQPAFPVAARGVANVGDEAWPRGLAVLAGDDRTRMPQRIFSGALTSSFTVITGTGYLG
jgi:hypothetical protein